MGLFDKAKELAAQGLDKAKDAGEIGKCKIKIADAEGKMKDLYIQMGKALATEHPDLLEQFFPEEAGKLGELEQIVADLKAQIAKVKEDNDGGPEQAEQPEQAE